MTAKKIFRIVFMTGIVCWFIALILASITWDFHKYSNVIVCESDLIQTCKTYFGLWHSFVEVNNGELKEVSFNRFDDAEEFIEQEIPRKYHLMKKIVIYEV